jgi:hypothetical protein
MKIYEHFGCNGVYADCREFLAGVECEIEAIIDPPTVAGFNMTQDHSLRNGGLEYVSTMPFTRATLVNNFKALHSSLEFVKDSDPFSFRTSTHVHINCQGLTIPQARTLVLLYALFEELLFSMVKPDRRNNIHCVPLTETYLPANYKRPITYLHEKWHKYTALNIKRLNDLGTMEFRHLHGTNDVELFSQWLSVLEGLWNLCQKTDIAPTTLTKDNILRWFDEVFAEVSSIKALRSNLFNIIRNSLIDVKFACI